MKKYISILFVATLTFLTFSHTQAATSTPLKISDIVSGKGEDGKPSITIWIDEVALDSDEKYRATCSLKGDANPYQPEAYGTGKILVVGPLQEDSEYECQISIGDGDINYRFSDVETIRTKLYSTPETANDTAPQAPPAGYEDEVITNYEEYDNPFPDTDINDLEGKAAAELYRRAVIGGFPDGEFKGVRNVNRAEAAKFLLLARGTQVQELKNNGKFWDVREGEWYVKYVMTAESKGIIKGHPDGSFKPADNVNTAEFIKMLTLAFNLQTNLSYSYSDVQSSDWFAQYAGTAKKYNLFPKRTASQLQPSRHLSRNEVAVAIYQYLSNR